MRKTQRRLEEERYKETWLKVVGAKGELRDYPHSSNMNLLGAINKDSENHDLSADLNSPLNINSTGGSSTASRKRKLSEPNLDDDVSSAKEKRSVMDGPVTTNKSRSTIMDNERRNGSDSKAQFKLNTTESSDETMLDETPPLLREISEILHEESALGLPQTMSEDVHLKNSGSEITFSQFCEGAKLKGKNFRTSTQNDEGLSESIDPKEIVNETEAEEISVHENEMKSEDTTKMEPLVYCPSGSSASSAVDVSPAEPKKLNDFSVMESPCNKLKTISEINISDIEKIDTDTTSVRSDSSSIKVVSSNGSVEIDLEVIVCKESKNKSLPRDQINQRKGSKETAVFEEGKPQILDSVNQGLVTVVPPQPTEFNSTNKESKNENIEIVSDNSSSVSLFSAENNNATVKPTSYNNESNMINAHNLEEIVMKIPDRCFYKSAAKPPSLTEDELDVIYDDENSPVKYFSYCYARHLPMLTLDVVYNIVNTNSLTMTVTFISITPPFDGSWKENCFKSQCPSCNKLYDIYNVYNNRYTENTPSSSAILVGSHVVCPESQCCNQILNSPVFHFTVDLELKDGTPVTALLASSHAEEVFGCTAKEALRNENEINQVRETLEKIARNIEQKRLTKIVVTREDICDPKSGPVYIKKILF